MLNKILLDQCARAMSDAKYRTKTYYMSDMDMASAVLEKVIEKIEEKLSKCPNVENGICNMTWRHEDCLTLMDLLYDMTNDPKYRKDDPWRQESLLP